MTPRLPLIFALTAALLGLAFLSPDSARAQDKDQDAKAKAKVVETLKKAGIDKPTVVESQHFIVAGSLPQDKAKALSAVLEKTLAVARKAAKYDEKDSAWKGKLAVYFLPDNAEYKAFMRRVLQLTPEGVHVDFRSDPAMIVDPAELTGKPTDADLYANTAARVAGEILKAKGTGTQIVPEWLRDGFGRVAVMRAEGTGAKRYASYKAQAKAAVFGTKSGTPATLADAMSSERSPNVEVLANSLAEFLAFNPKVDFGKFLDALRPSETNQTPTPLNGFMALGWKDEAGTEQAWKRWVQAGR